LEAVSAYPSYKAFGDDVSVIGPAPRTEEQHRLVPTKVFGWEFFIPDSAEPGLDEDRRLLEKARTLAIKPDYIELRGEFYKWWSDVSDSGMSAEELRTDMEERIAEYHKIIKGEGWKTAARYAIKIADAFSGGLGLVNEVASAGAEAFLGSADVFADERLKRQNAPPRLKVAAMFHDARAEFGWKTPK
jgi:nucleotide-binding universal stress UspA family protein